jgi:hypothetical protein
VFAGVPPATIELERALLARAPLVLTGGMSLFEAKRHRHPDAHASSSRVHVPISGRRGRRARTTAGKSGSMLLIVAAGRQHARLAAVSPPLEYQPQTGSRYDLRFRKCFRVGGGKRGGTGLIASRWENRSTVCGCAVLARK